MNKPQETYIDHEVRIRMLELMSANVEKSLNKIAKNTYFILAIFGGLLTTLIVPVFLHLKGLA